MYEYATEDSQKWVEHSCDWLNDTNPIFMLIWFKLSSIIHRYKEGRVILEQALITESEGFADPYSAPPNPRNPNYAD